MADVQQAVLDWARTQNPALAMTLFCATNIILCSVLPLPFGVFMMVIAGVLYGQALGLALYLSTSATGAWITFLVVRCFRERIIGTAQLAFAKPGYRPPEG